MAGRQTEDSTGLTHSRFNSVVISSFVFFLDYALSIRLKITVKYPNEPGRVNASSSTSRTVVEFNIKKLAHNTKHIASVPNL